MFDRIMRAFLGPTSRWRVAVALMVVVAAIGVVGFMSIGHLSFIDALYQTVTTLTTVGYADLARDAADVHIPLDPSERTRVMLFTIFLVVFGIGAVMYAFSLFVSSFVEGELRRVIGLHRTRRRMLFMKNHYIICGFGHMGEVVAGILKHDKIPFLVIERDAQRREAIEKSADMHLIADATHDSVLREARIENARGLIAITDSDPENLFITLSARQLNPRLSIVSRALSDEAEQKLLRAGANRVILPYKIGAHQLAQAAIRPNVLDFVEIATRTSKLDIEIEELEIPHTASFAGKPLREAGVLRSLGLIVIGIRRPEAKEMDFNPSADTMIRAGDILVFMGKNSSLLALHKQLK
jgi:voltage-gated potassium channel